MKVNSQPPAAGIFITDIVPTGAGTVANKVMEDTIVLASCESDTLLVTVSVIAFSGSSHLIPRATVNGVSITNFALNGQNRWVGSVAITAVDENITVVHEDGAQYTTIMSPAVGPVLSAFNLTGGYPGAQTELKLNDAFSVAFTSNVNINRYEIDNFEASQAEAEDVVPGLSFTKVIAIANRGTGTIANQRVRIRCRGTNGIWGDWINTDVFGSGDGSAYVQLNNDAPVVSIGAVTYPASQGALKDSETADVVNSVTFPSGTGTVAYTSPNGDISIANDTTYEANKTVTRIAGNYNISTNNFRITATKTSNASVVTVNSIVKIAHVAATLAITELAARLRSGGNAGTAAQNHVITITASQQLYAAPTLDAPVGAWQGGAFAGGPTVWIRSLQIHDDDTKGTHAWGAILGTNLAGIPTTAITGNADYVVGGFVFRTFFIAAYPNREGAIGTRVVDTAKLRCTNLSKGASGSLNFTFVGSVGDQVDTYTITDPSETYNINGNLWRNNDLANSVSNSTGLLACELEELV